jgi:hypothetical protein
LRLADNGAALQATTGWPAASSSEQEKPSFEKSGRRFDIAKVG